ncbi:hypothetical protein FNF28_06431 [Cafeteria roenbergensis]|uniref:EF-hand domain-containing protein n=1 Tax=Cafeteria roenbergensis TaxID=33653 RepID=A0A5A8CYX8_CAFRO|nr:hypothetical protein FNF28_06431 [Cafeteria roenbergensis]
MAFFGITSKGPQNPFRAATEAALGLALFSKADIEAAFRASCRSSTIGQDEADEFLVQLYHGPAPAMHEKRLKDRMLEAVGGDYSGRLDLEQLLEVTAALQAEEEAEEAANESMATTGIFSAKELQEKRARHMRGRGGLGGANTFTVPQSRTGHASGWELEPSDAEAAGKEIRPKRKCAETKFAERLLKAGELL